MQIQELKIYSSDLKSQKEFYTSLLGLNLVEENKGSFTIQIGTSLLTLQYKAETTPYHYAINIPANKYMEALRWLKTKVEILKDGSNEIQDFESWNAKAMYFYDKDQNIVELIARKNLDNNSNEVFSSSSLLNISEIGLPSIDNEKQYNFLNQLTGIPMFDGGFERFCAIGDDHGLFICINSEKKDWFPTNDKAYPSDFEIQFTEQEKEFHIQFKNSGLSEIYL